jgi:hypothetical protein
MHSVFLAGRRDLVLQFVLGFKPVVESVAARYSSMFEVNPASLALNLVQSGRVTIDMGFDFFLKQYRRIIKTLRAIDSQNMIHKWPLSQAIHLFDSFLPATYLTRARARRLLLFAEGI